MASFLLFSFSSLCNKLSFLLIPPISKIFSYVAQQQEHQLMGNTFVVAITKNNVVNSSSPSLHCTHYARSGHTENICYWKHGFPSTNDNKGTCISSTKTNKIRTDCGRTGHIVEVCYQKQFSSRTKVLKCKESHVNNTVAGYIGATESDHQQTSDSRFSFHSSAVSSLDVFNTIVHSRQISSFFPH
ncbi:hypothetical protein PHAVU_008G070700 [Phaseolus vulgaris]|uniref:Uncharacterized protein n=1 Tax=Phaseolus vulgaris TaxID=3885 RepID=V7B272_PHAVU|nr:hypothetical protein PHAVU_008G070700g [Phaseolus vulgaris]ESW11924.1 hypothetical protein PHAVU_008G070700g [Phaseolus vulgaris]